MAPPKPEEAKASNNEVSDVVTIALQAPVDFDFDGFIKNQCKYTLGELATRL
jgi:hypothetical protein